MVPAHEALHWAEQFGVEVSIPRRGEMHIVATRELPEQFDFEKCCDDLTDNSEGVARLLMLRRFAKCLPEDERLMVERAIFFGDVNVALVISTCPSGVS